MRLFILYFHLLTSAGCLLGEGRGGLTQLKAVQGSPHNAVHLCSTFDCNVCRGRGGLTQLFLHIRQMYIHTSEWFPTPTLVSPSTDTPTHFSIDSHPTLEDINKFVVCEVATDWKQVATFLGVEPSVISTPDTDHRRCEHACTDIFERWLSWKPGTGRKKRTWQTVLSAVEEAGHKAFSQQLQTEMLHLQ